MLAPPDRKPSLSLDGAIVYDLETLPNVFTMNALSLADDSLDLTFEISEYMDERDRMFAWFWHWHQNNTIMIGFNNLSFDFAVLHFICENPRASVREIYAFAMQIIAGEFGRWGSVVWQSDRFAPQCDLYKVHHFDNPNKSTSLKQLEFNMRSENVMECPLPFNVDLTREQIDKVLIPYNKHDVKETRRFANISKEAISLRLDLMNSGEIFGDVLNFSDTKIGSKLMEQRLGRAITHDELGNIRQTHRTHVALGEVVLPFVRFRSEPFQKVLERIHAKVLTADEIDISSDNATKIKTKGVFSDLKAVLPCGAPDNSPFSFDFGVGGIHGSVSEKRFDVRGTDWRLIDIDVSSMYPSIGIVNRFYPEHLGERFVEEYAKLPIERAQYKKGTPKNTAFKLAGNGTYGNSNNRFSVFYDPKFTMSITINGQLQICMLAEWLMKIASLSIVQANTDGLTYLVHKDFVEATRAIRKGWERLTKLQFEEVEYGRMWIKNVNNYIAETIPVEGKKPKLKLKGDAYWYPETFDDITNALAWHKNLSCFVVQKAAVAHMVNGADIGRFVRGHQDAFDFMLRTKVDRSSTLWIGDVQQQRVTRYYIAVNGEEMTKVSPPTGVEGEYKRRSKVSDYDWHRILAEIGPGVHDPRIHTKNKSKYEERRTRIAAGCRVKECNIASRFDWESLDFGWYVQEAEKLIIPC